MTSPSMRFTLPMKSATKRLVGPLVELVRRGDLLHRAAIHDRDPARHRQRLVLVVGDDDEGDADALLQAGQLELHLLAQLGVERRQRLVEQQHLRALDQARASATRWRCPPDSWSGLRPRAGRSRTISEASLTRGPISAAGTPPTLRP